MLCFSGGLCLSAIRLK